MLNLVCHSLWHGIISTITWIRTLDYRVTGNSWISNLDHIAFYVFIGIFVVFHIVVITWFYCVPLKHRRQMREKDDRYRTAVLKMMRGNDNQSLKKPVNGLPTAAHVTIHN
jgi:hypothetical protein